MKSNIIVIYKSKYGSTEQYAKWISDKLCCDMLSIEKVTNNILISNDIIIFGGGLYAGGIAGISIITNNWELVKDKDIILFTVGLSDPYIEENKDNLKKIIDKALSEKQRERIKIFHLRGSMDYKKLSFAHKSMMKMLKTMLSKKSEEELTDENKTLLKTYGENIDFKDEETITPIIDYVLKLSKSI